MKAESLLLILKLDHRAGLEKALQSYRGERVIFHDPSEFLAQTGKSIVRNEDEHRHYGAAALTRNESLLSITSLVSGGKTGSSAGRRRAIRVAL
jgi:hypothetical protein